MRRRLGKLTAWSDAAAAAGDRARVDSHLEVSVGVVLEPGEQAEQTADRAAPLRHEEESRRGARHACTQAAARVFAVPL
jgi:hypothetical protein